MRIVGGVQMCVTGVYVRERDVRGVYVCEGCICM